MAWLTWLGLGWLAHTLGLVLEALNFEGLALTQVPATCQERQKEQTRVFDYY